MLPLRSATIIISGFAVGNLNDGTRVTIRALSCRFAGCLSNTAFGSVEALLTISNTKSRSNAVSPCESEADAWDGVGCSDVEVIEVFPNFTATG